MQQTITIFLPTCSGISSSRYLTVASLNRTHHN